MTHLNAWTSILLALCVLPRGEAGHQNTGHGRVNDQSKTGSSGSFQPDNDHYTNEITIGHSVDQELGDNVVEMTEKDTTATESEAESRPSTDREQGRQRALLVKHRVFTEYCADVVTRGVSPGDVKERALGLVTSDIFPACLHYECRTVFKMSISVCDSITEHARALQREAIKYKKRSLHVQALRQRASRMLYLVG